MRLKLSRDARFAGRFREPDTDVAAKRYTRFHLLFVEMDSLVAVDGVVRGGRSGDARREEKFWNIG